MKQRILAFSMGRGNAANHNRLQPAAGKGIPEIAPS
jgi:hypothetical protein